MSVIQDGIKIGVYQAFNVFYGTAAPVDGAVGVGTLAGIAPKGAEYVDRSTGNHYYNKGTQAVPAWKLVTTAA